MCPWLAGLGRRDKRHVGLALAPDLDLAIEFAKRFAIGVLAHVVIGDGGGVTIDHERRDACEFHPAFLELGVLFAGESCLDERAAEGKVTDGEQWLVEVVTRVDRQIEHAEEGIEVIIGDCLTASSAGGVEELDIGATPCDGPDGFAGERVEDLHPAVVENTDGAEWFEIERAGERDLLITKGDRVGPGHGHLRFAERIGKFFGIGRDHLALRVGVAVGRGLGKGDCGKDAKQERGDDLCQKWARAEPERGGAMGAILHGDVLSSGVGLEWNSDSRARKET